jgi:enamine deaminase RidA (YjgF/YER057c/UK114 family)
MQLLAHDPTDGVYPSTADYVHAMEVRDPQRLLFVAGTMGLDPGGAPGATLSYLRDASYAEANAAARVEALGGRAVPTTAIVAETLVDDWLVEIEVIAAG